MVALLARHPVSFSCFGTDSVSRSPASLLRYTRQPQNSMRSSSGRNGVQRVRRGDEQAPSTDRTADPDSYRGTPCSAPDPGSRAAPRRIAAEVAPQLVHFVQHQHRIVGSRAPHGLNHASGHRADIGAAMAAQFGFIMHAAQAHALELAVQRARDGLPERSFADSGRAHEAQNRRLRVRIQLQARPVAPGCAPSHPSTRSDLHPEPAAPCAMSSESSVLLRQGSSST
jgi:hypothetical protein